MNILIPLDPSECSRAPLAFLERRSVFAKHCVATLVTVFPTPRPSLIRMMPTADLEEAREQYSREIFDAAQPALDALGIVHERVVAVGDPIHEILRTAKEHESDVILMGAHGERHLADLLMGSVSSGVVAKSTIPVLLIRDQLPAADRPIRIAIAVDQSEPSQKAIDFILSVRHVFGPHTDFRLIHAENRALDVLSSFTTVATMNDADIRQAARDEAWHRAVDPIAKRFAEAGLESKNVALSGNPSQAIADYVVQEDVDMIVMGSHQQSELRKLFLGSRAQEVAALTRVPLLIVR